MLISARIHMSTKLSYQIWFNLKAIYNELTITPHATEHKWITYIQMPSKLPSKLLHPKETMAQRPQSSTETPVRNISPREERARCRSADEVRTTGRSRPKRTLIDIYHPTQEEAEEIRYKYTKTFTGEEMEKEVLFQINKIESENEQLKKDLETAEKEKASGSNRGRYREKSPRRTKKKVRGSSKKYERHKRSPK